MNEESIKQDIYETIADLNAMTDYHFSMTPAFYTDDEGNPINKPVMDKTGTEQLYALYTEFSGEKNLVIRETLKNLYNHLCIISHLIYVKANAAKTDEHIEEQTNNECEKELELASLCKMAVIDYLKDLHARDNEIPKSTNDIKLLAVLDHRNVKEVFFKCNKMKGILFRLEIFQEEKDCDFSRNKKTSGKYTGLTISNYVEVESTICKYFIDRAELTSN